MADASKKLMRRIQGLVYKKQRNRIAELRGKYVQRNGVTYLVVSINSKIAVLSDVGTKLDQIKPMSTKAFLGKKVTIVDREKE